MAQDHALSIQGVNRGRIKTTEFVELPIILRSSDRETIRIYIEAHIMDQLPIPVLLGTNALRPNKMDIIWESPNGKPALRIQGHFILLETQRKENFSPKRVSIYT